MSEKVNLRDILNKLRTTTNIPETLGVCELEYEAYGQEFIKILEELENYNPVEKHAVLAYKLLEYFNLEPTRENMAKMLITVGAIYNMAQEDLWELIDIASALLMISTVISMNRIIKASIQILQGKSEEAVRTIKELPVLQLGEQVYNNIIQASEDDTGVYEEEEWVEPEPDQQFVLQEGLDYIAEKIEEETKTEEEDNGMA